MSPTVPNGELPLAPDCNPQQLPDLAPPVPGVRPWQWLADPDVSGDDKQAYLEQFRRGHGTVDPFERGLLVEEVPEAEVIRSHLTQDIVCELAGAPAVTLRFSAAPEGESSDDFPFAGPLAVIGTVPPVQSSVQVLGRQIPDELRAYLADAGLRSRTAVGVDAGRRWVEPVVISEVADTDYATHAAKLHLQPYHSIWRVVDGRTVVEVVDTATAQVVGRGFGRVGKITTRTCPMIPGAQCGDLCRVYGGPWTSHSIHALARWERKRARMIDALGCDTCGDGAIRLFLGRVMPGGRNGRAAAPEAGRQTRHSRLVAPPEEPG